MPELRKDPIIGRWVIISTERGKRPHDFVVEPEVTKGGFCPFDPGNEHTTPPEVLAYRDPGTEPNGPGWQLRVVANKFPALAMEGNLDRAGEGMFDKMNGVGAHEVIIESPDHNTGETLGRETSPSKGGGGGSCCPTMPSIVARTLASKVGFPLGRASTYPTTVLSGATVATTAAVNFFSSSQGAPVEGGVNRALNHLKICI